MCGRKKGHQPSKDKNLMMYAFLEKGLRKFKVAVVGLEIVGLESTRLVDIPPQYKMWKVARTTSNEQMISQST